MTANDRKAIALEILAKYRLTMRSKWVPWSMSWSFRHDAKTGDRSLNWGIELLRDGKPILATSYTAGIGHLPNYKQSWCDHLTVQDAEMIERACESGRVGGKALEPDFADVVYSLISDGEAIDSPTYEQYAEETGMEVDSRKGEAIYRECLRIGLALRAALGESGLAELREAFQDY